MKKKSLLILALLLLAMFVFVGCSSGTPTNESTSSNSNVIAGEDVSGSTVDIEIKEDTISQEFTVDVEDDDKKTDVNEGDNNSNTENQEEDNGNTGVEVTEETNTYVITEAGTYTISGKLDEGQIYVNVPDGKVEIELEDVSISNSTVAPIYVLDCDSVTLKVKKNTTNYIYDNRTTDYSESTDKTVAQAAIYVVNGNLKINGTGTLTVTSLYNSGIQSRDNVTIKNCTLLVKAMNNGIKGNDKVTIEENPTIGIVCGNNGIRTSNSDMGSSAQHGYIYINGGTITINSYGDGIDAEYGVEIGTSTDDKGNTYVPVIDIYTNKYSSYTLNDTTTVSSDSQDAVATNLAWGPGGGGTLGGGGRPGGGFGGGGFGGGKSAEKADDSAKGIKANELINITAGEIFIYAYDDGIHTNDDQLETGVKASANINISGGTIKIKASDDGIHADGTLTISGGVVYVQESHEGLEGNTINITGGDTTVFGNDDGVNASKAINISGGRLDVTVSPNGDTDGIDSNGTITISGGTTITRGPNSEMMAPLDADGTMKMTGGTLIVLGYSPRKLSVSGVTKTTLSGGLTTGTHTVTIGDAIITYNNTYTYSGSVTVYGSGSATVK